MRTDRTTPEVSRDITLRDASQVPNETVRGLIESSLTPPEALRLLTTLEFLSRVEQTKILVVFHGPEAVGLGFITPSMHSFDHWGINVSAIRPGFRTWEGLNNLVSDLTGHAMSCASSEGHPPQSLAISGGTRYPEILERHGFQSIHKHSGPDGRDVAWMMTVSPNEDVTYHQLGFSEPEIAPRRWDFVRPLTSAAQLREAAAVIELTWGRGHAEAFLLEASQLVNYPGSQVYGIIDEGKVRGVGVVIKGLHHPEAWSRAWIVIDPELRGGGYGTKLIQALMYHAESLHPFLSDGPMVMEGNTNPTTVAPDYYAKFGNMRAAERVVPGGRSVWSMRITAQPSAQSAE